VRELFQPALAKLDTGEVSPVLQDGGEVSILKKMEEDGSGIKFLVMSYQIKADPIATVDQRAEEADDFSYYAKQDGFEDEAENRDFEVQEAFGTKGNAFVAGLGQSRQIMSTLEGAGEGTVSNPIELSGQFLVLKVTEITPAGVRSFDEVKSQIRTTVLTQKRKDQAAQRVADMLKNNSGLEALAEASGKEIQSASALALSAQTIPGSGREPTVIGALFGLQDGSLSGTIRGNSAVFVAETSNRIEADPEKMNNQATQQIRKELQKKKSSTFSQVWLEQLKEEATIEDYRNLVLQGR
jgi:hypothetical protein